MDPLLPFHFIIAVESLSWLVSKAKSIGLIKGCCIVEKDPIPLLQYVNDALSFLLLWTFNFNKLEITLLLFEAAS